MVPSSCPAALGGRLYGKSEDAAPLVKDASAVQVCRSAGRNNEDANDNGCFDWHSTTLGGSGVHRWGHKEHSDGQIKAQQDLFSSQPSRHGD